MENTVYFNGIPMRLAGRMPEVGEMAPKFTLTAQDLSDITLDDFKGRRLVLNIFPSLDTDVCAASVRRFNVMASELENTSVLCVSADLPFAASKFCAANDIKNVSTGSSFRSSFGKDYGVEIADGPLRKLLARAIVVIGEDGKVIGTSLRGQITDEPDYDYVISLLK